MGQPALPTSRCLQESTVARRDIFFLREKVYESTSTARFVIYVGERRGQKRHPSERRSMTTGRPEEIPSERRSMTTARPEETSSERRSMTTARPEETSSEIRSMTTGRPEKTSSERRSMAARRDLHQREGQWRPEKTSLREKVNGDLAARRDTIREKINDNQKRPPSERRSMTT